MIDEPGIRFGIGHAILIGAVLVTGVFRLDPLTAFGLVLLTAVVGGRALGLVWRAGLAMSAWAMFTGFDENRFGILTFSRADLLRLGLLVAGCVVLAWPITRAKRLVHP
ncbi:MAG: hypothetical protein ABI873_09255 [Marmoricola sp.]